MGLSHGVPQRSGPPRCPLAGCPIPSVTVDRSPALRRRFLIYEARLVLPAGAVRALWPLLLHPWPQQVARGGCLEGRLLWAHPRPISADEVGTVLKGCCHC